MKKKKILFVCYGGGHAAMLAPVISEVNRRGEFDTVVLALTTAYEYLKKLGVSCVRYKDLTHLSATTDWKEHGTRLVGSLEKYNGLLPFQESVAYYGINFADLVCQLGSERAARGCKNGNRQLFYPVNFMSNLLHEIEPDLVVTTNAPRSERAVVDAASFLGLQAICLVDLFAAEEFKWIAKENFGKKILVLNQSVKEFLVSKGRKASDIEVTGNPAFDAIYDRQTLIIAENLREQKYDNCKINILFASNVEPEIHPFNGKVGDVNLPITNENMLREFIETNPEYRLVVRYHPSQDLAFKKAENVLLSPGSESLHSLLHCMDIVVTGPSTVGLEGYLAGKKVISIDTSIFSDDSQFSKLGISQGVETKEQLFSAIHEISSALVQEARPRVESNLATPNVCYAIEQLLENA